MKNHLLNRLFLGLFLAVQAVIQAQSVGTTLVSRSACPGELLIPIRVTDCRHVGAFSLVFSYNPGILTYSGYQNLHAQLTSGMLVVNPSGGKVYISWASMTPANIAADTLIKIRFTGITGTSSLTWDTQTAGNCEYSDSTAAVLPSTFTGGTATVYQVPVISSQPVNSTVTAGQNTSFSVSASGNGLTYQWQISTNGGGAWNNLVNGGNYSNVTTATLAVAGTTTAMSGNQFRCAVGGTCPSSQISTAAVLTVNPVPLVISTTAGSTTVCPGNAIIPVTVSNFTGIGSLSLTLSYNTSVLTFLGVQNVNPALSSGTVVTNASGGKVYMTWASSSGASITGSGTLLELVFSGTTGNSSLTWDTQTPDNCEYSDLSSNLLTSTFSGGSITFLLPPVISADPVDRSLVQGQNTTFTVSAGGAGLTYQWQISTNGGSSWSNLTNTAPYSGATAATLSVSNATLSLSGYRYRCIVSGTCPSPVTSGSAMLTVNPTPQVISANIGSKSACPGPILIPVYAGNFNGVGSFSMAVSYNPSVLSYVDVVNRHSAISGGSFSANAANGLVYITWASSTPASAGNDTLFRISFTSSGGTSALNWDLTTAGACEITDGSAGIIQTTWSNGSATFYQPPVISSHPADKSVTEGQAATFSVGASATGIAYQWKISTNGGGSWSNLSNNATYSGVAGATLTVSGTTLAMSGHRFLCAVSGSCPSPVSSNTAQLTVTPVPQVITVTARPVSSTCAGLIRQPVYALNFNGVAALSLALNYDTNTLRFIGPENPHTLLNNGNFYVNSYKGKIYVVWASSTAVSIGNDTLFRLKFDCSGGTATNTWDTQTPGNCELTNASGTLIQTTYNNGAVTVTPSCSFGDLPSNHYGYSEIQYLCNRGIVGGSNCLVYPESTLKRSQLAKVAFLGLFGSNVAVVSDAFPSPFNDLQNTGTYYYRYAKALSYLEYWDGVSPFDRDRFNFDPEKSIARKHVLKVLLETFNIPKDESGPSPFSDISPGQSCYGYIKKAYALGILESGMPAFRPDAL